MKRLICTSGIARTAFVLFAIGLFTGTHWPNLELPMRGRPDLVVHMSIFGAWTVLLYLTGWLGAVESWRPIALVQIIGIAYAAVDEGLQAIPWIRRTAAWDDYAFDVAGVVAGAVVCMALRRFFARPVKPDR